MAQDFNYQGTAMAEQRADGGHSHDMGNGASNSNGSGTPMPAQAPLPIHSELKRFRLSKRESQEKFWGRFGVTQSSGSRFETGLGIPAPVAILVKLYVKGKLSDGDLPG